MSKIKIIGFSLVVTVFLFFLNNSQAKSGCAKKIRLPLDFTRFDIENYKGDKWMLTVETITGEKYIKRGLNKYTAMSKMTDSSDYREMGGTVLVCLDEFDFMRDILFSANGTDYKYPQDLAEDRFLVLKSSDSCNAVPYTFANFMPAIKLHCGQDIYIQLWECKNAQSCALPKIFRDEYFDKLGEALSELKGTDKALAISSFPVQKRQMSAQVNLGPFKVFESRKDFLKFIDK